MSNNESEDLYYLINKPNKSGIFGNKNADDMDVLLISESLNQAKQKRLKRLESNDNSLDSNFKFKKHFFVNDSYKRLMEQEQKESSYSLYKEMKYYNDTKKAEFKLKHNKTLNLTEIKLIITRNFYLLTNEDKKQCIYHGRLFYLMSGVSIVTSVSMSNFMNALLTYSNISFLTTKRKKSILYIYTTLTIITLLHFVREYYYQKMQSVVLNNKETIIDERNLIYKTPYNENYLQFDPRNKTAKHIYNI